MRRLKLASAATTAAAAAGCVYAANEKVVEQRSSRLDRLRDCQAETNHPRVAAHDHAAQSQLTRPIVVEGLLESWPARHWTFDSLRDRMRHTLVDTGSAAGKMPFYLVAHNATELKAGRHDLALYVFDGNFESDAAYMSLTEDWRPLPTIAGGDVFASHDVGAHADRPSWRWLLAGPPGSGTPLHFDPWGYSSWNASLVGVKRWVFFPPDVPRDTLHPPRRDALGRAFAAVFGSEPPRPAADFMDELLPALRQSGLGHVELLQRPGEVVAFPAGWWHAVVNLTPTIAVTESFGRPCDLELIACKLRSGGLAGLAADIEENQRKVRGEG